MQTDHEKAFVAGATGYTGWEVVKILAKRKIPVIAHVRSDSAQLALWRQRVSELGAEIDTTPWSEAAFVETFARLKPTMIFSLLGTTRRRIKTTVTQGKSAHDADYWTVDYGLSALLPRAAQAADLQARFIYLSAVGVGPKARSAYYQARYKMESELIAGGMPYIVARPSFITGADREEKRPLELATAKSLDGVLRVLGAVGFANFRERFSSLSGPELATALVNLAVNPEAVNRIYETDSLRRNALGQSDIDTKQ